MNAARIKGVIFLLMAWSICMPAQAKVYGLVIGIDEYATLRNLEGAAADARDVSAALKANGADVSTLLNGDATRGRIEQEWRRIVGAGNSGDTVVFAYAGHGGQEPDQPPLDEADGSDEALLLAAFDGNRKSVGFKERIVDDDFYGWLQGASGKGLKELLVLDSCHSGGTTRQLSSFRGAPVYGEIGDETIAKAREKARDNPASLTNLEGQLPGVYLMSAVEEKKLVPEVLIDGQHRGALSYAFSRGLEGAADANNDGKLSANELQAYVAPQVSQWAEAGQVPDFRPAQFPDTELVPAGSTRSPLFATSLLTPPKVAFAAEVVFLAPKQLPGAAIVSSVANADLVVEAVPGSNAFAVRNQTRGMVADQLAPARLDGVVAKWRLVSLVKKVMAGRSVEFTIAAKNVLDDDAASSLRPYVAGETISITSGAIPAGHYATVLAIAGEGSITVLDPASSVVRNPRLERPWSAGAKFEFTSVVQPPYGADHILMITSTKPLAEIFTHQPLDAEALPRVLEQTLANTDFRLGLTSIYTSDKR